MLAAARMMAHDRGAADPISLGPALFSGKKVRPDAINLLVMDHMEAKAFFARYHQAQGEAEKRSVAIRLCQLLSVHMQVEEEIFYPAARDITGDDAQVTHAEEEHAQAKALIAELRANRGDADALVLELEHAILHHVKEEETRFFPEIRAAGGLHLHDLGAQVAARRLQLLIQTTGKPPEDPSMQSEIVTSVGAPLNMSDTDFAAIDPDEARRLFVTGLKNHHALAENARTMAQTQAGRVENYPRIKTRMEQRAAEKETQLQRLEQALDTLGESPSGLKDVGLKLQATIGGVVNAMASDEIMKNSLVDAAGVQMEIASYQSLILMGQAAGAVDAIRLLQKSLSEERAMAAWLEENLPGTIMMLLQRRSAGETAKH